MGAEGRRRRRRRPRRAGGAAVRLSRPDRGRARPRSARASPPSRRTWPTRSSKRGWFRSIGALPLGLALGVFVVVAALLFAAAIDGWRPVYPRWGDVVLLGLAVAAVMNAMVLVGALTQRRLWRRRSKEANLEARAVGGVQALPHRLPAAARGSARDARALGALPRLRDRLRHRRARPAGGAPRDAGGAAQASSIYWISPGGNLGSGPTSLAIGDLASGFGSALSPPSSGSGGGGGGFSGGGGGGEEEAAAERGEAPLGPGFYASEQGFFQDFVIVRNASFAGISVPTADLVTFE